MAVRHLVNGIAVTALGILSVALAVVEYYVSTEAAGRGASGPLHVSFGTGAYVLGYLVAGAVLVALGIGKIYRAARRARARPSRRA